MANDQERCVAQESTRAATANQLGVESPSTGCASTGWNADASGSPDKVPSDEVMAGESSLPAVRSRFPSPASPVTNSSSRAAPASHDARLRSRAGYDPSESLFGSTMVPANSKSATRVTAMPKMSQRTSVYDRRSYLVASAGHAQQLAAAVAATWDLDDPISFGLPEVDDRYHVWRIPLLAADELTRVGELVIDAHTGVVDVARSTTVTAVAARVQRASSATDAPTTPPHAASLQVRARVARSEVRNTILLGRSESVLSELPASSIQLMFTSPPYFNARPDYADYHAYEEYLSGIRAVLRQVNRVLEEGRFAVVNSSPVLIRRAKRSEASRRIAVPFDIHQIAIQEGFDFIDDIIWQKPEGAGWATGRGRRFAADRNPLQYKAVPVTEYVIVYRKRTTRLIDWHIRNHHDPIAVKNSQIDDGYERTNVWRIKPSHSKFHPAVFPRELAERVIKYYSFKGDAVLDPYAGIGTVGEAAVMLGRRFVLSEANPRYVERIRARAAEWLGSAASEVLCVNCPPVRCDATLY